MALNMNFCSSKTQVQNRLTFHDHQPAFQPIFQEKLAEKFKNIPDILTKIIEKIRHFDAITP